MGITKEALEKMLRERKDYQREIQAIDGTLQSILCEFDGTVIEAIRIGLVRPNFPTSAGFRNYISQKDNNLIQKR